MTRTLFLMRAAAVALSLAAAPPVDGAAARAAAEPSVGRRPNQLPGQSSPYLLEHLDNPVDWYPWGEEALERARREGRPIFLSIGYSACHWCHVMAREAFSDEGIARILNERFVPIKVDREESQAGGAAREAGGARGSLRDAVARLGSTFDRTNGGFGRAPKFPPHG